MVFAHSPTKIILIQNFVGYNLHVEKVVKNSVSSFEHYENSLEQLIHPGEP